MTRHSDIKAAHGRNFYGRRIGKSLRPSQQRLLAETLGNYQIPGVSPADNPSRRRVNLAESFQGVDRIWLEVGFGSGEHLARLASLHPETGFVGCEPYINGVASLLAKLQTARLTNVRVHPGDVRDVFEVAGPGSVDRVFLLYPDPWPKRRHHRRRFVTPEFLVPLAGILAPGSELRLATDIADYARQAVVEINRDRHFEWQVQRRADWLLPWAGWQPTRYEQKAIRQGRRPIYLTFVRRQVMLPAAMTGPSGR